MEKLYKPAKTRLGADCGSNHELLIAKFRLKLKKVGKTTRPFRYHLNQIPYDYSVQFSSVTQSCPTLQPHGLQHSRLPCPLPLPGAYSNSCPLSQRCYPTISSSVIPFSSSLQSFPASGSFQMRSFQGLFSSPHQVAKVLEFQFQHQSFHLL